MLSVNRYFDLGYFFFDKYQNNFGKLNEIYNNFHNIVSDMNIIKCLISGKYYGKITNELRIIINSRISNLSKISKELEISYQTLFRIMKKRDYWCNIKILISLGEILSIEKKYIIENIILIKTHNSFPFDFKIINLDLPDFYSIIGHILGDCGFHIVQKEGKYRPFYSNVEKNLLHSFTRSIKNVFGNVKIYKRERKDRASEVWLSSSIGLLLFEIMSYDEKHTKMIPSFIINNTDPNKIGAFLQAIYDDDGYLYPSKKMIVFAQKRKHL
ncbi:MAG: hypothetical protein ACOC1K_02270, partial [Nanoarchaeota archaeon]